MRKTFAKAALAVALVVLAGCAGPGGPKEIRVDATGDGFVPDKVAFAKGRPAVLIIKRTVEATCATEAIFVETGRKYDLPLGEEVRIDIPTDKAVTFHYACGMNMYKGEVVVK
jgi:plastocyanin domain-containing protein